jgi:RNA polymerase sigma factor (sigma-70 family)
VQTRTTTKMVEDLQDASNREAWGRFDARYRPVIIGFARHLGLPPDDAAELAQRTMAEFAQAYLDGRYERSKGRLSSWLIGIARNIASVMRRPRGTGVRVGGDTLAAESLATVPHSEELHQLWNRERQQAILSEAMHLLRSNSKSDPTTLRAFELAAVRGVPAEAVATQCGIEVETVYVIKNRLTKRLREIVRDLTAAYDDGE